MRLGVAFLSFALSAAVFNLIPFQILFFFLFREFFSADQGTRVGRVDLSTIV